MDICVCGLGKAGKTSILKVIFQKMNPQQCMMLEPTQKVETVPINLSPLIHLNVYDFPGNYNFTDPNPPEIHHIEHCGAMIYVLGVQAVPPYSEAIQYLYEAISFVQKHNKKCSIHVFIHKTDSETFGVEEKKTEILNQIKEQVNVQLENSKYKGVLLDYHLTTIYDQTLFEAFSKVTHKVIPQVPLLTTLLEYLIANCRMEKAFLFEVVSKLYIATDAAPVDIGIFAMCAEMIDVYLDISFIYGNQNSQLGDNQSQATIRLSDGTTLLLKEVEKYLVLICIIKDDNYDRPFLIDYNIDVFRQGLGKLFGKKQ